MAEKDPVSEYIAFMDPKLRVLARKTRSIVRHAIPEAEEGIKMGVPVYSVGRTMIVSIADYANHINLYFLQGAKLSSKLLEGTGKGMRHIKIESSSDIRPAEFARLVKQAAKLARGKV